MLSEGHGEAAAALPAIQAGNNASWDDDRTLDRPHHTTRSAAAPAEDGPESTGSRPPKTQRFARPSCSDAGTFVVEWIRAWILALPLA